MADALCTYPGASATFEAPNPHGEGWFDNKTPRSTNRSTLIYRRSVECVRSG